MHILKTLQSETKAIHRELEETWLLKKIMTHNITTQEYRKLLLLFYQFINPRETHIKNTFPVLLEGREKSPLLLTDLSNLPGGDPDTCAETASSLFTEAHIYGYLYVMEGATLGGQVITQALKQNPLFSQSVSICYFNAYGEDTRRKWEDFTDHLQKCISANQEEHVVKSAVATFTQLLCWLKENTRDDVNE